MFNFTAPKNPTTLNVISHSSHENDGSRDFMTFACRAGVTTSPHLIRL